MYQQWGNLTLECKICDQLTNSCPSCWNRNLDYFFSIYQHFFLRLKKGAPLGQMTRNFYTQQLGILKNSKNFVKNTQAQHLDEVSDNKNTFLSLHTNFKSTSNPNSWGDVRSLPRRRQRLWRTSCRWEVLRSWEGETRLHFEQITILIKLLNHRDPKAEPAWFKSVSLHFQPKWSIGGYPHVVGRVIRGHRFIETY